MVKIICPNCNKENVFQSRDNSSSECSFCYYLFPSTISTEISIDELEITGLTIIYQMTQERLEISTLQKTILGRTNFGANIFDKIFFNGKPVVSRKHFSIEFRDNKFYLLDEGSLNGTFYSVNKISCKNSPQVIQDKSVFFIGEEAFHVRINYIHQKQETSSLPLVEIKKETKAIKLYRCNDINCSGFESPILISMCPICGTYNSLIPIYG